MRSSKRKARTPRCRTLFCRGMSVPGLLGYEPEPGCLDPDAWIGNAGMTGGVMGRLPAVPGYEARAGVNAGPRLVTPSPRRA